MINHRLARVSILRLVPLCIATLSAIAPACVQAEVDFKPLATATVMHDSNVFARPPDEPPFAEIGNTALGDTIQRYLVGADAIIGWGLDRLTLNAQGEKFDYNRFDQLNHYESRFGGAFDWYLGSTVDGTLGYSQRRAMASLADTLSDQLETQTDRVASATVRIHLTPRWRLDLQPTWHEFETPLLQFPTFGDRETGGSISINYLGIQKLTAGLRVDYLDGHYHGIVDATRYHQTTGQLTADYAASGLSSFNGQLGYTKRQNNFVDPTVPADPNAGANGGIGDTTTFTGSLGFHRELSVKTGVSLRVFREVDSYVAGANSEIGTGGEASLKWAPDVKFTVILRYRMATESIQGTLAIADFANRVDHVRDGELDVEYYATRWLTVRPYVLRDERSSNFHDANFNATTVGIDLTAHLK